MSTMPRNPWTFCAVAAAAGIMASGLFFAEFLTSRFDHIAGNFGDARFIIYLHEHWYNVYRGREEWLSPPFFFPVKHVLAYSHTLFLQSLPYSLLRLAGLDPYISFEATLLLFSWVGYGSTIGLLRQLGVQRGFALVGAILFVFSNIFQLLLSLVVVVGVIAALSAAWDAASRRIAQGHPLRRGMALGLIGLASTCLLLEQVNLVKTHGISRREEQARLGVIAAPPFPCDSFFLLEAPSPRRNRAALQIDAMLISQRVAVPTINGYSGFIPPGWNLADPAAPDYLDDVERWVSANHLRQPCALQIDRGKWIAEPLAHRRTAGKGLQSAPPSSTGPTDLERLQ